MTRPTGGSVARSATMAGMAARVLVVEDDPASAEMLAIALRQAGFETAVVGEGTKAMPALREMKPDVVLLDLMLPGMSGIEATRRILADHLDTAVLVLTMFDEDDSIAAALRAGARGYLLKGASGEQIRCAIHAAPTGRSSSGRPWPRGCSPASPPPLPRRRSSRN